MAVIQINKNPSRRDLTIFGLLFLAFAGLVGWMFLWRAHAPVVARAVWIAGAAITAVFFAVPPLRKPIYLGWIYATYPIGFVLSHVLLALIYYGVFTPIGVVMRLLGNDPMARRFDRSAESYWIAHDPHKSVERYFHQS